VSVGCSSGSGTRVFLTLSSSESTKEAMLACGAVMGDVLVLFRFLYFESMDGCRIVDVRGTVPKFIQYLQGSY